MTPVEFTRLLDKHNITSDHFLLMTDIPRSTYDSWLFMEEFIPPYIERTVQAIAQKLAPIPSADIKKLPMTALCDILQVDELTIRGWINYGRFPRAVRLAMATCPKRHFTGRTSKDVPKNSTSRIALLKNIELGQYRKGDKTWRSPPVMGKKLPDILNRTVDELRLTRYAKVRKNILYLTIKAQRIVFKS